MYAAKVACPNCDTSSVVPYDDPSLAPTGEVVDEIFSWNTAATCYMDSSISNKFLIASLGIFPGRQLLDSARTRLLPISSASIGGNALPT